MTAGQRFTLPAPSTLELPASLARRVHVRDGRACVYYGARGSLVIDHLRPRSHVSAFAAARLVHAPANLVTACVPCIQAKRPQNLRGVADTLRGRGLPASVVAAMVRWARASVRRGLPLTVVP